MLLFKSFFREQFIFHDKNTSNKITKIATVHTVSVISAQNDKE